MTYDDFEIFIQADGEDLLARVLRSPAGEGSAPFRCPFEGEARPKLFQNLNQAIRGSAPVEDPKHPQTPTGFARRVGTELFQSLFTGQVAELYRRSLERTATQERGLRIKLRFDLSHPASLRLTDLPWELWRDPGPPSGDLALATATPVVRFLDVPNRTELRPLAPPLRVLVVAANPIGTEALDLDAERSRLDKVAGDRRIVDFHFLDTQRRSTSEALGEELAQRSYHALHFMGHGSVEEDSGRSFLLFESAARAADPVGGQELAQLLQARGSFQLVTLNCCHSGQPPASTLLGPFSAVGTALVHAGIPAVVVMRTRISDAAAMAFSQRFYGCLSRFEPVDAAVASGRHAMWARDRASIEWSVPVLYLRSADGRLFEKPMASSPGRQDQPDPGPTDGSAGGGDSVDNNVRIIQAKEVRFGYIDKRSTTR